MSLRDLPSVEKLLGDAGALIANYGRPLTLHALRVSLDEARLSIKQGAAGPDVLALTRSHLRALTASSLRPVINATGVILHTNLGRAPLSDSAIKAMQAVAAGYSTLEFDVESGRRGSRTVHSESLLTELTGAEAALVVNNNAAAVLLALTALARRKEVIISRSQLVEIGGGFRIPEVLQQSGAKLVEVGTTNRTHLHDYENAISEKTALVLRVHSSNFRIVGFATEPRLAELTGLAASTGLPVLDDLGSGALLDTSTFGLAHEPTVRESLLAGAGLVAFSGDKLLGGPQAGILVGQRNLIAKLKQHPLARAVRADKLCLAALAATLVHYLKDEALREIPVWRMIASTPQAMGEQASAWAQALGHGEVIAGVSTVGGGSLPEETIESRLLALDVRRPDRFMAALRRARHPVIARIHEDQVVLDPRTVLAGQEALLLESVRSALSSG